MGNNLSFDFFIDYAIYNGLLDDVEYKSIDTTCRSITIDDFCGLHQMEAVIKLIWYKSIYEKSHISNKYAHVAKKLEDEVEGGTNLFSNVFGEFVKNTIASNLNGIENINETVRTNVATFLGHLFVVDAIDSKALGVIIKPAYGIKSLDKAMKVLSDMIQKKLTSSNLTFDGLFSQNQSKDVKKLKQDDKRKNSPSPAALENIKDYESYCSHYNSIGKRDIHQDERLFNPKLIATLKIKTKEEIQDLCEKFLERCIQHETYLPIYAQIALRIHSSLQNTELNKEISFRSHLIDTVVKRFEKVAVEKDELDQRIAIALYGEMYNLNWVSKVSMNNFIGALKALQNDNSYVILMQSLLKICSTKLAVQGSKIQMIELRDEMKKIARKEDRESHLKYMVHDSLSMLNYVVAIQEQYEQKVNEPIAATQAPFEAEKLTIDNLYKDMSEEAYLEVITDIKSKPIENLAEFIEKLLQKAISTCAILIAKATRDICTASYMKEVLSNKCHSTFLDYVRDLNKSASTLRLIHYIGELYNYDVLSNDFINLCFEILFENQIAMGTSALMRSTGLKMETANAVKLNVFFQFFEHIARNEQSSRAKVFRKLMALRANEWNDHGIQHSYEDFLMLYTIENATADEVFVKFRSDHIEIEKFIYALWKVVLKDPHPSYAELCQQLSKLSLEFNNELIEFIKQRGKTFANLESQHYNETVNCRLGKVVVFVAELYQLNVIPDIIFENYLDPKLASKIPQIYVLAILSIVSQKIDETSPNGKLKILITNLEHINEDKSQQKYNTICGDMNDIKEAINELKLHQKH